MIRRQIPNLITLGNLLCGVIACLLALGNAIEGAALFICLGIFLDFFDGLAARLLNVASPLGKELDSLADVVTSGVAPGFLLWNILCDGVTERWQTILPYIAFLIPLFAAYRLAKFNIDSRQSHSFLGLPTPANALIWVGVALTPTLPAESLAFTISLIVVSLVTNILMVSEMPMFSLKVDFKKMGWKHNSVQYLFLIGCAAIIVASRQWYAISLIILWYIILSAITQRRHAE
jgi:CDP-diacylglycerol--serine O-phosphatidyltransferase